MSCGKVEQRDETIGPNWVITEIEARQVWEVQGGRSQGGRTGIADSIVLQIKSAEPAHGGCDAAAVCDVVDGSENARQ